jgi:hypothetical protein
VKRSERLAHHYIRAADLRAVYVAAVGKQCRVAITREPSAQARVVKRTRGRMVGVQWVGSSAAAVRLVDAAADLIPGIDRGAFVSPAAAIAALRKAAAEARVTLTDDKIVQARAAAVVCEIEDRVANMQKAGQLRGLNAAYREGRADAARQNATFMSYGEYLVRYKIRLLYDLARASH